MLTVIKTLCAEFGKLFGFSRPALYGGITILAILLLLIGLVITLVCVSKRKKRKKLEQKNQPEQVEERLEVKPVEKSEEVKQPVNEPVVLQPVVQPEQLVESEEKLAKTEKEVAEEVSQPEKEIKEDEPEKVEEKPVKKAEPKKLKGKWIIEKENEGEFVSKLLASNGEVMLTSEIYTTAEGARSGVETIIRGIENGKFIIYQNKNKNYYYKIKSQNNRLLCAGEIYKTKEGCQKAVESVKRIASISPISEEVSVGKGYAEYTPATLNVADVKKGTEGKWRIIKTESGNYSACLFASNGQIMLATEEVALEKSAKNAMDETYIE